MYNDIPCEDSTVIKEPDPGYIPDGDGNYVPAPRPDRTPDSPPVEYVPAGENATLVPLPLPADNDVCAKNFILGRPNTVIVTNPGAKYFYTNEASPDLAFPDVYIPGYRGKPVPVVDRYSGEIVAVVTSCPSWSPTPNPAVTVVPGSSPIGIVTDDPDYDIILSGFHISNTGFQYCDPVVEIYDKDKRTTENAQVQPILRNGRIVELIIINSGTGFRRIPEVRIYDNGKKCGTWGGNGAVLYPIMSVVSVNNSKPPIIPVDMVYCPAKNSKNLY